MSMNLETEVLFKRGAKSRNGYTQTNGSLLVPVESHIDRELLVSSNFTLDGNIPLATENHSHRNLRNSSDSQCNGRFRASSGGTGNETDDEYYTDEEDEVFINGGIHIDKFSSKPLMYPRNRPKLKKYAKYHCDNCTCRNRKNIKPVICCFCLMASIGCMITLLVFYFNDTNYIKSENLNTKTFKTDSSGYNLVGCNNIKVEDVWTVGLPKLNTESSFRLVDVNSDGILDVIFGFGTGADGYFVSDIVCDIYFGVKAPCFGGMMALDGLTGKELWRHYSIHELFGINCNEDLNNDGILDCTGGGRAGAFDAVSGKDGTLLWTFDKQEAKNEIMNLYTSQVVKDLDGDGIRDILAIHGGDPLQDPGSKFRLSGRIVFFSGKTGKVLQWVGVPDDKESYYSPQVYQLIDGLEIVLFGTGGETHGGSLWYISLDNLYKGEIDKAQKIYSDEFKGVMTPPVLLDLTGDGVEDIVMAMFNSSVLAIDGISFKVIWNYTHPMSESYNTPAPGYYNEDNIPDFMIKYANGPGFPLYYFSDTTILDGKTGLPLINPAIRDSVGAQASPLSISVEGFGNDIFLYWMSDCLNFEGKGGTFEFVKGTNVHEQSRSDFCRLRYKTQGYSKIYAISKNTPSPGTSVYYSIDRKEVEHSKWVNTTQEALNFIKKHPEHQKDYEYYKLNSEQDKQEIVIDRFKDINRLKNEGKKEYVYQPPLQTDDKDVSRKTSPNQGFQYKYDSFNDPGDFSDYEEDGDVLGNRYPSFSEIYDDLYKHNSELDKKDKNNKNSYHPHMRRNSKTYSKDKKTHYKRGRRRRHVGPHDNEGLQRLLSTGTLAPTTLHINHPDYNNSIELIFGTYWFFPADTHVVLPEDKECISKKLSQEKQRFSPLSEYYGMDHDAYEHVITQECLKKSGRGHEDHEDRTYESQTTYNPYNVHMGQMTVYRLRLTCSCANLTENQVCSRILPFDKQQWYAYMGNKGDSHWKPRDI
ncbi:Hypothetical predicted protein [Mytilus galloprovincialis]|uniref:FAM234A/B beta-propeller domain-containing protein n=1 Tax=Mytilus galloprovincialis TaxID=29158 RepID=A0A8B6FXB4_MYTGA|nr:Hypothetical predicted protein [Mytilus galloprovincialis]